MFTIKLNTNNDAFAENELEEISGCLIRVAAELQRTSLSVSSATNKMSGSIRDTNGNTVGKWELR